MSLQDLDYWDMNISLECESRYFKNRIGENPPKEKKSAI